MQAPVLRLENHIIIMQRSPTLFMDIIVWDFAGFPNKDIHTSVHHMLSTLIFAAIDGTNQTYTNFKLKIEPSVFSLKFVDVCPRSCDLPFFSQFANLSQRFHVKSFTGWKSRYVVNLADACFNAIVK